MGVISGRILECYFPPPFYSLPPGEGKATFYEFVNYVLVETCALVQHRLGMKAIKLFQEDIVPVLRIEWIDKAVHHAAIGIMLAAERKEVSLVDCVSFETMRLLGVTTAFTLDKHFKEQGFICLPA
ncbi:MAG TPA: hypothetical protein VJZ49_09210 [Syntrophales bacterium]|nr:hypothetical protein [Syntrophales bacterium]